MKKTFFLIIVHMCLLTALYSQSGWFIQSSGIDHNLYSVYFVNESTGWVVGSNYFSTIATTTNGGINWILQNAEMGTYLHSVHFENSLTGWVVGGNWGNNTNNILKTTNGGNNWFAQSLGTQTVYWVDFINLFTGWCVGEKGLILKTTNGGTNWLSQGTDTVARWNCVKFLDSFTGWSSGFDETSQMGIVIKTTNGGSNWYTLSIFPSMPLVSIFFTNNLTGWLLGIMNIYKSTNGGVNWFSQYGPTGYLQSMYFVNNLTGWVVCSSGTSVLRTSNGGGSWVTQPIPTGYLSSIYFVNSLTGWSVGSYGGSAIILKTTTGGEPIGIISLGGEIPKSFSLSQNYPNPFNPVTKIRFDVPKSNSVTLTIYDILGSEVATLVNEQLQPGTYEADWDATSYSSGIYFYKLITESFSETKRMVLIK